MKVKVTGAPGYRDFEGELLMEVPSFDDSLVSIIGVEFDSVRTVEAIPSIYVEEVD